MQKLQADNLYRSLVKAIAFAAVVIILLWLLHKVIGVLLLFLFAVLFAIIINAPVSWLEKKKIKRGIACAIVFGSIILIFVLLGWLIFPKIYQQLQVLIDNLPGYINSLVNTIYSWVDDYPELGVDIKKEGADITQWLPSAPNMLSQIRNYSVSIAGTFFMSILFTCIVYMGLPGTNKFITEFYILSGLIESTPYSIILIVFTVNYIGSIGFCKA